MKWLDSAQHGGGAVHHRRGSARDICGTRGALGALATLHTFGGRSNAPHEPKSSTRDMTPITIAMWAHRTNAWKGVCRWLFFVESHKNLWGHVSNYTWSKTLVWSLSHFEVAFPTAHPDDGLATTRLERPPKMGSKVAHLPYCCWFNRGSTQPRDTGFSASSSRRKFSKLDLPWVQESNPKKVYMKCHQSISNMDSTSNSPLSGMWSCHTSENLWFEHPMVNRSGILIVLYQPKATSNFHPQCQPNTHEILESWSCRPCWGPTWKKSSWKDNLDNAQKMCIDVSCLPRHHHHHHHHHNHNHHQAHRSTPIT